jgi:hypothetical protein
MSEQRKNMEFEFKDEYWLEAKKLLEKEEKKRRFFFWFTNAALAGVVVFIVINFYNSNDAVNNQKSVAEKITSTAATNTTVHNTTSIQQQSPLEEKAAFAETKKLLKTTRIENHYLENNVISNRKAASEDEVKSELFVEQSSKLKAIDITNKWNLDFENNFETKNVKNGTPIALHNYGKSSIYIGTQLNQAFYQKSTSNTQNLSGKIGVSHQYFLRKNIYITAALEFNLYQHLVRSTKNASADDEIQKFNLTQNQAASNDAGNSGGISIQVNDVSLNTNNTYTIAGITYNPTDVVTRKTITNEDCVYGGTIGLPIAVGIKLQRFSFQAGLTQEYLLFNKVHQNTSLFINNTALTITDQYVKNNYTNMNRWLTFATIGIDYNITRHIKIGIEAKNLMNKNYHNTLQSSLLIKYAF